MNTLQQLYRHNLALLTDLYQLTMAHGYWRGGLAEAEAVFQLTFRRCPFGGEFAVACGLAYVVDLLRDFRFESGDLDYLESLTGQDGRALFDPQFLLFLRERPFACDLDAIPEGTAVFPHQPLVRVRGPLWQAQVIETALLNIINFQTLVATKAARVCFAAAGDTVIEFGLRRAQGVDGGLAASRAAYIGGCHATSHLLAGKLFQIPVRGTHAHSWVMAYGDELAAFRAYAAAMPNNCVFLVDTYDTLQGIRHAVIVGKELRQQGHELLGVRLDSGDLGPLSIAGRKILDDGGFPAAAIVASNDLDEQEIVKLKAAGAQINVWGIGTKLVTAYDQPALGGVYKLAAMRDAQGVWQYRVKLSEQAIKTSNPGIQQVRRYLRDGLFAGDVIYDELMALPSTTDATAVDQSDLLVPIFRQGECVYAPPTAAAARERTREQLARLNPAVTALAGATPYPVCLEPRLASVKASLITSSRENNR